MNKEELKELLSDIAESDLEEGSDIHDHPCTVAVRALDQCFEDIESLRKVCKQRGSKRMQMLIGLRYNPTW